MKFRLIIGFLTISIHNWAQGINLVPNYSFEQYDTCPAGPDQIHYLLDWFNPTNASPDYFNSCSQLPFVSVPTNYMGYQQAFGNGYVGLGAHITANPSFLREYVTIKLTEVLQPNKEYCISFFISLCNDSKAYLSSIGLYLSDTMYVHSTGSALPYIPQITNLNSQMLSDTLAWTYIEGQYIATGGEKYITIGNFQDNSSIQYTYFNPTDTVNAFAYYYIEDVFVGECDNSLFIPNVFTPNSDNINDYFQIAFLPANSSLTIYSRWGNQVYHSDNYKNDWNGYNLSDGVYYYILNTPNAKSKKGTITILRD